MIKPFYHSNFFREEIFLNFNSMPTYKLDITLVSVKIEPPYIVPGNKVWFNFNCDGCNQSATTPCVPMQPESKFGTPCQFIINTADTMGSYFYLTLCYYGPSNEMIPLARARSRIGRLPLEANTVQSFQIPLMSAASRQQPQQIALALFKGTLATIQYQGQNPYTGIPQQRPSVNAGGMHQYQQPAGYQSTGGMPTPQPQGSFGGATPAYQQNSVPNFPQPGMMTPNPYPGAVPFNPGSQGMQQPPQHAQYGIPIPGPQAPQPYQYPPQPQAGSVPQQPGNLPPQAGSSSQPNNQNQIGSATIGDNQYYF